LATGFRTTRHFRKPRQTIVASRFDDIWSPIWRNEMFNRSRAAFAFAMALAASQFVRADSPSPQPANNNKHEYVLVDKQQLQQMVHEEVQRQLRQILERQAAASRPSILRSTLLTLRSQIALYKLQHDDVAPALDQMINWSSLLQKTNERGQMTKDAVYGPYLETRPRNALTGKSALVPFGQASKDAGWVYDSRNGHLKAALPLSMKGKTNPLRDDDIEFFDDASSASVK
jgi:hypothetical protein